MDDLIQIAALLAAVGGAPHPGSSAQTTESSVVQQAADPWLGEDKFRHFAVSWAATAFAYGAARSAQQDRGAALAISLPLTAALGIGKEIADRRRGGAFSARDLVADALGAGAAWLFLREVR